MVKWKSMNFEREPAVGSAVCLGVKTTRGYGIDTQPTVYLGSSNGTHSFIKPAEGIGMCVFETSQVEFVRDGAGFISYSPGYELKFVRCDEENYEELELKLLASGIWSKK